MNSIVFQKLIETEALEVGDIKSSITDILNQCFIDSATWGLKYWEEFLKIPVDENKDNDYRRSVVKSKLRGIGTVNSSLLDTVAESYVNGTIEVTEDNPNYQFIVRFVDVNGIPPNLDDLKNAIEEIKPAHLQVLYRYKYLVISEMDATRIVDLDTMTLNDFENYQ